MTLSETLPEAAAPPPQSPNSSPQPADEPRPAVGYGHPPAGRPFAPGVSGNPLGRPRRLAMASPAARRLIPAEPTELERALAEPILCLMVDPSEPVPLARAVVARLTERAVQRGDVAACRELLRLCAEAESVACERELLAAEEEAARRRAEDEAARAAEARAREARNQAREEARAELEYRAETAARQAGEETLDDDVRALMLLDAVEIRNDLISAFKPWVVEAAQAHDPALPRLGDLRPIDLAEPFDAGERLDILQMDEDGLYRLAAWFIDAARARKRKRKLTPGDEALLQVVRVDPDGGDPDWAARLAFVEGLARTG